VQLGRDTDAERRVSHPPEVQWSHCVGVIEQAVREAAPSVSVALAHEQQSTAAFVAGTEPHLPENCSASGALVDALSRAAADPRSRPSARTPRDDPFPTPSSCSNTSVGRVGRLRMRCLLWVFNSRMRPSDASIDYKARTLHHAIRPPHGLHGFTEQMPRPGPSAPTHALSHRFGRQRGSQRACGESANITRCCVSDCSRSTSSAHSVEIVACANAGGCA
jgi:hypothetical protein